MNPTCSAPVRCKSTPPTPPPWPWLSGIALLALGAGLGAGPLHAQSTPPVNDAFANRITLAPGSTVVNGTTVNATREPGETGVLPNDPNWQATVWYQWAAPADADHTATVNLTSSSGGSVSVAFLQGDSLNDLKFAAYNIGKPLSTSFQFQTLRGGVYYVVVSQDARFGTSAFNLAINLSTTSVSAPVIVDVPAVANDNFASAVNLTDPTGNYLPTVSSIAYNLSATREATEPTDGTAFQNSLWWQWVAPADATVTVNTDGSNLNSPNVAVFTGPSLAQLKYVAVGGTRVTFPVYKGEPYALTVGNDTRFTPNPAGDVVLNLNAAASPSVNPLVGTPAAGNDFFAQRTDLGNAVTVTAVGYIISATRESFEPTDGNAFSRSLWWQWTAPGDGSCTLDTSNSGDGLSVAVFTGAALSGLQPVGSPAGGQPAHLTFPVTAGTVYALTVGSDARFASGSGGVVLNLAFSGNVTTPPGGGGSGPTVTLTKPAPTTNKKGVSRAVVNGAGFAFKGTVSGGQGGIKKVVVNLAGYGGAQAKLNADGTWKARFSDVPAGVYPTTVSSKDNAGNKSAKLSLKLVVH